MRFLMVQPVFQLSSDIVSWLCLMQMANQSHVSSAEKHEASVRNTKISIQPVVAQKMS